MDNISLGRMKSFIDNKKTGYLNSCLVFDLETTGLDIEKCDIISFHAYSYSTNKYYNLLYKNNQKKIYDILINHNLYVTYNGDNFDIPILDRIYNKTKLRNNKFSSTKSIDLLKIIIKRSTLIKYGGFKLKSLYNISRELNLKHKKSSFDFTKKIDYNNAQQLHELFIYAQQDVNVTKELFEYLINYFEFYKEYLPSKDIKSWSWLMSSPGTYAYKVICHLSGLEEKWPTTNQKERVEFEGGYVSKPIDEIIKGKIYCFDFNSAYPHAYMMINLFGYNCTCCKEKEKYNGKKLFSFKGRYCTKKLSSISETIKKLYKLRVEYKKNKDKREVALKIILNTLYGICGNPTFINVFNINTASDCTYFVRESLKYARKIFSDNNYNVIYSDTDSVYLKDNFNDENKMIKIKDKIIKEINSLVPFPMKTFDMGIDSRIKLMYFPGLKKKNYLYITEDNQIKIKGLPIMKDNASHLSMHIFNKYLKNNIINGDIKMSNIKLKRFIYDELNNDITKAFITFNVKEKKLYKNNSNIYSQISEKYGIGRHNLIPINKNIGVGISKKFINLKEFKKLNLNVKDINLTKIFKELQPFSITNMNSEDNLLLKWI